MTVILRIVRGTGQQAAIFLFVFSVDGAGACPRVEATSFHSPHPYRVCCVMLDSAIDGLNYYMRFYGKYFSDQWNGMGPTGYGILLISIGLFGWLLMKSGVKGPGS